MRRKHLFRLHDQPPVETFQFPWSSSENALYCGVVSRIWNAQFNWYSLTSRRIQASLTRHLLICVIVFIGSSIVLQIGHQNHRHHRLPAEEGTMAWIAFSTIDSSCVSDAWTVSSCFSVISAYISILLLVLVLTKGGRLCLFPAIHNEVYLTLYSYTASLKVRPLDNASL